ncbi:hypothetical protein RAG47_24115, partial [Klebsiella pneumoniae]
KRAYCLKTQPATGETYPKSDLFNKAHQNYKPIALVCRIAFFSDSPFSLPHITGQTNEINDGKTAIKSIFTTKKST